MKSIHAIALLVGLGTLSGCGSDEKKDAPPNSGAGGISAGGLPSAGGATGGDPGTSTGGVDTGSGGVGAGGGPETGGVPAAGGTPASGGAPESGGSPATGGAAPDGGRTDAGPAPSDGGFTPNPGTVGVVLCTEATSCTSSELCCVTPGSALGGTPASFACSTKPCVGGDVAIACDGAEDCSGGQHCCRVNAGGGLGGGSVSYACRETCAAATVGCAGPQNCPAGTVCCETVAGAAASETVCAPTCEGASKYVLCRKDADCPANTPTCVDSTALPGFRRCQ